MQTNLTESSVEEATLELFSGLGYTILHGPDIAPGELFAERSAYDEVELVKRLREALTRINPKVPGEAIEETVRKILSVQSPILEESNRRFHKFLTDGINVEYRTKNLPAQAGRIVYDQVKLFDFDDPANNDWVALNQFTVIENKNNRRPDVVVFVNGLPLAVFELKNLADENATIRDASNQLQTYKKEIPACFRTTNS